MRKYLFVFLAILCFIVTNAQLKSQSNWQQKVDYLIDVKLDDKHHFLNGEIAITYHNNSPATLDTIYFHIWPNAYKSINTAFAKQVEENGDMDFYFSKERDRGYLDSLNFKSGGASLKIVPTSDIDVIKVVLNKPLAPGQKAVLFTPFRVKIPKVFSRLGHKNQDYFITQWYPKPAVYDVNGWNPMPYLNQGEFYSEFGSFKVRVSLPENYTIVATGECQTAGELEGTKKGTGNTTDSSSATFKTVEFKAENVHDFAWFASKRFGYETKVIKLKNKDVLARVVASDPKKEHLDYIETAITYYSDKVGEYPYSHATVVHGELKAGGGMEYPMITICDYMGRDVIIHEVGHNWFYGILGSNERLYPWMDESINSFYDQNAAKTEKKSKGLSNEDFVEIIEKDQLLASESQAINLHSEEFTDLNYGISVYGKGSKAFYHLRDYLGEDLFDKCMRNYYQEWKFKHPLPNDMHNSFEKTCGEDLDWFFDGLLGTSKKLDYGIEKRKEEYYLINKGEVAAPMPVVFATNGAEKLIWMTAPANGEKKIENLGFEFQNIRIDTAGVSLDLFPSNDEVKDKIVMKFGIGKDKPGQKEVYWVPTLAWNAYDKFMLGAMLHNYSFSNKPLQYHIMPMYSFTNKSLNGIAEINYTSTKDSFANYTEYGFKAMSYNFRQTGFAQEDYKYVKLSPYVTWHLPKSSLRSPLTKQFKLQVDHILLKPQFEFNDDTLSGPRTERARNRSFITGIYKVENDRKINGYQFELMAEVGSISNKVVLGDLGNKQVRRLYLDTTDNSIDTIFYFPNIGEEIVAETFARLSGSLKYNVDIGMKDKPLELRFYGSWLLKEYANATYKNTVGTENRASYNDYRFDDVLVHRNPNYGMFRNQISNRRDFSKFVGPIAQSDKWLISANLTVPLPGKIPLKPYAEIIAFNDMEDLIFNDTERKFFYNVGIEIEIIPNRLEIFVNLAQSAEVSNFQESPYIGIDNLLERITFVLDLSDLTPPRIKKKLFKL